MKRISIVVPCYNEQEVLPLFYTEITKVMQEMMQTYSDLEFELLLIDDGSKDDTLKKFRELAQGDSRVPETLERKLECMRDFKMQQGTMLL